LWRRKAAINRGHQKNRASKPHRHRIHSRHSPRSSRTGDRSNILPDGSFPVAAAAGRLGGQVPCLFHGHPLLRRCPAMGSHRVGRRRKERPAPETEGIQGVCGGNRVPQLGGGRRRRLLRRSWSCKWFSLLSTCLHLQKKKTNLYFPIFLTW
jgi:hypothetical protein